MQTARRDMLKKILGLLGGAAAAAASADEALLRQIDRQRGGDPLIGAKLGSQAITQHLYDKLNGPRGVHIESMLCALGALGGFACQATVRAGNKGKGIAEMSDLVVANTRDGQRHFFGDALNMPLAGVQNSVWALVAGQAQQSGCAQLPDVGEIFRHAAESLGSEGFGKPRVPAQHQPQALPLDYLKRFWPELHPRVRQFCPDPAHWPILYGFASQEIIDQGKLVINPCLGARLVMEAAIPTSKQDLPELAI